MALVLDASVVLSWALQEPPDPVAEAAARMMEQQEAIVPALLWFEVRNGMLMAERRSRITPAGTVAYLSRLASLPLQIDRAPDEATLLRLGRAHGLTVYDAAYLELAARRGARLATLDRALRAASGPAGVALVEP